MCPWLNYVTNDIRLISDLKLEIKMAAIIITVTSGTGKLQNRWIFSLEKCKYKFVILLKQFLEVLKRISIHLDQF